MPIYDWICEKCGLKCELISMVDEKKKCRKCGNVMKRLPTQATFILKGDGWAKDGYARREK